jgi:hypothetical protein
LLRQKKPPGNIYDSREVIRESHGASILAAIFFNTFAHTTPVMFSGSILGLYSTMSRQ